jgi:hypothetical protein
MSRVRLTAGAELDTLNQHELHQTLRAALKEWMVDVAKGATPIRISAHGTAGTTGLATLGGETTLQGGKLGPDPGFWWAVTRLALRVDSQPGAGSVYLNRRSEQTVVRDITADCNGYVAFGEKELMIAGGETLVVSASSLTPGSTVYVTGAAIEFPVSLLWKWTAG